MRDSGRFSAYVSPWGVKNMALLHRLNTASVVDNFSMSRSPSTGGR